MKGNIKGLFFGNINNARLLRQRPNFAGGRNPWDPAQPGLSI